ncbi:MAG: phosphatidate cytidylyltransferase [bacterium]|nr:phosphatidate cytidylyltransferase [bacterium]
MQVDPFQVGWKLLAPVLLLLLLGLFLAATRLTRDRYRAPGYLGYFWIFLFICVVTDFLSFTPAVWLMALVSFRALREYFSLVDLRLEDRWGVLGSYLSIPFMIYLIQIDWYGFFIISIPVYVFIIVPFLVALGDNRGRGSLLSIGAIDFGLFFFVYCLGHIAYLAFYSTWLVLLLLLTVTACKVASTLAAKLGRVPAFILSCVICLALTLGLRSLTLVPTGPAIFLGFLVPLLAQMGDYTIGVLERDLGISTEDLEPGRGHVLDSLESFLFTAPIFFHYLRWVMKFGDEINRHAF